MLYIKYTLERMRRGRITVLQSTHKLYYPNGSQSFFFLLIENDHYIFPSLFYPVLIIEIITFSMQEHFCEREIRVQQTKEEGRNFETNRNYFFNSF